MQGCNQRHQTPLHDTSFVSTAIRDSDPKPTGEGPKSRSTDDKDDDTQVTTGSTETTQVHGKRGLRVRLNVIPVEVWSNHSNRAVQTYAFLDIGSTATLCKTSLLKRLQINGRPSAISFSTVNGMQRKKVEQVNLKAWGVNEEQVLSLTDVFPVRVLPSLSDDIPTNDDVQRLPYLQRLDFPAIGAGEIELLIGADNLIALEVKERRHSGRSDEPRAIGTALGWGLLGEDKGCH